MIIYVVQGATGEYSDHEEWPVLAFKDEEKAKEHVLLCSQEALRLGVQKGAKYISYDVDGDNKYDPKMQVSYTGVNYSYFNIELMGVK